MLEHFIEVELPNPIDCIFGDVKEIKSILLVDEAIREYSENLVQPDAYCLILALELLFV
jgi:hypothetical protein